jgi:hypothetical protein
MKGECEGERGECTVSVDAKRHSQSECHLLLPSVREAQAELQHHLRVSSPNRRLLDAIIRLKH